MSASQSGVLILPVLIGVSVMSVVGTFSFRVVGYYTPILISDAIFCLTGTTLLTTLDVNTGLDALIDYQARCGIGIGLMMQQPLHLARAILADMDAAIGIGNLLFIQTFGAAVFVSL